MATDTEVEIKRQREARLRDVSERETRPWMSQLHDLDELGRGAIYLSVFVIAAVLILWAFGFDMRPVWDIFMNARIYAVLLALSVIFYRDVVARLVVESIRRLIRWDRESRETRRKRWLAEAQQSDREARADAANKDGNRDTFDGVSVPVIAKAISSEPNGIASRHVLEALGIRTKKVLQLQGILKNAQFPVYRFSARADSQPVGYENVAWNDPNQALATTLHPTLMTLSPADRGAIVANAIRTALTIPLGPEPRVHGDLSERGRPLTGMRQVRVRDP